MLCPYPPLLHESGRVQIFPDGGFGSDFPGIASVTQGVANVGGIVGAYAVAAAFFGARAYGRGMHVRVGGVVSIAPHLPVMPVICCLQLSPIALPQQSPARRVVDCWVSALFIAGFKSVSVSHENILFFCDGGCSMVIVPIPSSVPYHVGGVVGA